MPSKTIPLARTATISTPTRELATPANDCGIAMVFQEQSLLLNMSIADNFHLSGGNQQKTVLARWMTAHSQVLILDHPTRGLDVGAKEEVYDLVRDLSAQGIGIILMSDTLEETIGLSHTIMVMRDGAVTARFEAPPSAKPTQVALLEHMV
jgi:ABC-type sugar transport system ATPase subunit